MSKTAALFLALATTLLSIACAPDEDSATAVAAPAFKPILNQKLDFYRTAGLPHIADEGIQEVKDYLEASIAGGRLQRMAISSLEEMPSDALCAALLQIVEDRFDKSETRLLAYPWLKKKAVPAIIPRLILRLKYEKDWPSNVWIASTLLGMGNGAGLDALNTIMADENQSDELRQSASKVCELYLTNAPVVNFEISWLVLQSSKHLWSSRRQLSTPDEHPDIIESLDLKAECWRMIKRLQSQPLRPVDDARFVLSRMRTEVVMPELLDAAIDEDFYVREHALQTIAWIGYAVGNWDLNGEPGITIEKISPCLDDPRLRARALEACAVVGSSAAADLAVKWLRIGDAEVKTAAADCLLRTGLSVHTQAAREAARNQYLSPEAKLSLHLFLAESDTLPPPPPSADEIPVGEKLRRENWAKARSQRPKVTTPVEPIWFESPPTK